MRFRDASTGEIKHRSGEEHCLLLVIITYLYMWVQLNSRSLGIPPDHCGILHLYEISFI